MFSIFLSLIIGACKPCQVQVIQKCQCSQPSERIVECVENVEYVYSCGKTCDRKLDCGNHQCSKICHDLSVENCESCLRTPEVVKTCPCGKKKLEENSRTSCLDEIPSCGQVCERVLKCGPVGNNHLCSVSFFSQQLFANSIFLNNFDFLGNLSWRRMSKMSIVYRGQMSLRIHGQRNGVC